MSSKGRGPVDSTSLWETPSWVVRRLLEEVWLPPGTWLEPNAGPGGIIRAMDDDQPGAYQFTAVELRKECGPQLADIPSVVQLHAGEDFLTWNARDACTDKRGNLLDGRNCSSQSYFTGAITNPAFEISMDVLSKCLTICDYVVMLQRLNWLGCGTNNGKNELLQKMPPDVYVIPDRVQFLIDGEFPRYPEGAKDGKGRDISGRKMPGDSIEYCWYIWGPKGERLREYGRLKNLRGTDVEERMSK